MRTPVRIGLVIILMTFAAELVMRMFVTMPSNQVYDPEIGYRYLPHSEILEGLEGYARNRTNSLGLNSEEPNPAKTKRVLLLGDSYTEARQVPRERNFASVAASAMPEWDVINAGRDGLNVVNTLPIARRISKVARIDRIVLVMSNSDYVDELLQAGVRERTDADGHAQITMDVEAREDLKQAFEFVVHHSALAVQLIRQFKPIILDAQQAILRFKRQTELLSPAHAADAASTSAATSGADDAARARRLGILIQQLQKIAPVDLIFVHQLEYKSSRSAVPGPTPMKAERAVRGIVEPLGVSMVNTAPYLIDRYRATGEPPFGFPNSQIGSGHLNPVGHQAIAAALCDLLNQAAAERRIRP
jgi:hypothetical protein